MSSSAQSVKAAKLAHKKYLRELAASGAKPTPGAVRLRPKWLAALALILAIAAGFGLLAQWQIGNAIVYGADRSQSTETPVPIAAVNAPGEQLDDRAAGHRVKVRGSITGDSDLIAQREHNSDTGYWVVARVSAAAQNTRANLAVACGWAASLDQAQHAQTQLQQFARVGMLQDTELIGRYNPTEPPQRERYSEAGLARTLAPAQLLNGWDSPDPETYAGFLVLEQSPELLSSLGLEQIRSVAPQTQPQFNLLNFFYAVEWVLFAIFAIYFWLRITRDAWEREHEMRAANSAG